ncbi:DUF2199 domain-containing protein [Nocardia sp. NPDC060256]|uniref:DUF2199 domain-containing protein n=1 Tax=unclassified Nocardia TaxID=2637762 RepID=UPI003649843A
MRITAPPRGAAGSPSSIPKGTNSVSSEANPNEGSTAEQGSAHEHAHAGEFGCCPTCGDSLDRHNRHIRFRMPDPVLALPDRERTPGTWMNGSTPNESMMMQVSGLGAFVRALLPIELTAGYTLTYGMWLAIDPRELRPIFDIWYAPEYAELRIDGRLANAIEPWGLLASPVIATVRDPDQTPYCDHSSDPLLDRVLHEQWPHELFLDHLGRA